jgi:hypothetical protein
MEVSGQLHALATLTPQGKSPWYPLDRRLGGPQGHSGHGSEEKNPQLPPGIESLNTNHLPVPSQFIIQTLISGIHLLESFYSWKWRHPEHEGEHKTASYSNINTVWNFTSLPITHLHVMVLNMGTTITLISVPILKYNFLLPQECVAKLQFFIWICNKKIQLRIPRHRWVDTFKVDLREMGYEYVNQWNSLRIELSGRHVYDGDNVQVP